MKIRTFFIFFVSILILSGCKSFTHEETGVFTKAPIFGMIYGLDSRPLPGVTIVLDEESYAETDIEGRFILPGVFKGEHTISVSKEGFETQNLSIYFNSRTQAVYVLLLSKDNLIYMMAEFMGTMEMDKAREIGSRIDMIAPEDPEYLFLWAILEYQEGNWDLAEEKLEKIKNHGVESEYIDLFLSEISDKRKFDDSLF